jgi:1,4-alpha-glucan branching enzyme
MTIISPEQVEQIVQNQHPDPFAILGFHPLEQANSGENSDGDGAQSLGVIRAYLPGAEAAWVICPVDRQEYVMESVHHPCFFECVVGLEHGVNYQIRSQSGKQQRVFYDPYAFCSPQITAFDIHLWTEGNHHRIYEKLGAHPLTLEGIAGVYFSLWAPQAQGISIIGDFNQWQGRQHQMRRRDGGIWELFVPEVQVGDCYQYEIQTATGEIYKKSDPMGFYQEIRPQTASIVANLEDYAWQDEAWLAQRRHRDILNSPISVYEVHLGSWCHGSAQHPAQNPDGTEAPMAPVSGYKPGARFLTYRELAQTLIPYVKGLGYTHVELLPIAEHPFDGSWGYQVTGYYAPTSRFGDPQGLMYFIDQCHQQGFGVILDWVPGHFSKDEHGLARFDGTPLYEHPDPRKGEHKEWGTLVFNYEQPQVRNFLIANALFWFDKYHIDGIRVDAVASMLYLDYQRKAGEWLPNAYGGRENMDAVAFLRQVNHLIFGYFPGILSIAEESTAWPMVSRPTYLGGLGFNLKWNMGWMHDILDYFHMDPWFRQFHHNNVTFPMWYHHSENFMLSLSHDEVVHGKSALIGKMSGDEWQKYANLRCLFGYMYTHPGKKTLFMSMEFGQWEEWNAWADLQWELLQYKPHQQLKRLVTELNHLYCAESALHSNDFGEAGFEWIDCSDSRHSVIAFLRRGQDPKEFVVTVCNFTPQPHAHYRIGVPEAGFYRELFNSDAREYGGSNMGNLGGKWAEEWSFHRRPYSLDLCLPPLGVLVFKVEHDRESHTA